MKLIFPLFLGMLAMIGLGVWLQTYIFANVVGLVSMAGVMIMFFRQPDAETSISPTEQKRWYALFIIGLVFSLIYGSFWDPSIGNKG
jgi:hypothetical protein